MYSPGLGWEQGNLRWFCSNQQWSRPSYEPALSVAQRPLPSTHFLPCTSFKHQPTTTFTDYEWMSIWMNEWRDIASYHKYHCVSLTHICFPQKFRNFDLRKKRQQLSIIQPEFCSSCFLSLWAVYYLSIYYIWEARPTHTTFVTRWSQRKKDNVISTTKTPALYYLFMVHCRLD